MRGKGRTWTVVTAAVALALFGSAVALGKFGKKGWKLTKTGGSAEAVAIAPGGKIVAAGGGFWQGPDFATVRYLPNGRLDTGFGEGGLRYESTTDTHYESAYDVAALRNGKIVVVGEADPAGDIRTAAAIRYKRPGVPDTAFGGGVVMPFLNTTSSFNAVAVQRDGKVVAAGSIGLDLLVARLRKDGTLDPSFGEVGFRIIPMDHLTRASAVAIDRKGKIVVAGTTQKLALPPDYRMAFVRLRPNGNLDKSFSKDGKLALKHGQEAHATDVRVRKGKIYAVGYRAGQRSTHPILVRLTDKGRPDKKFAGKGVKVHRVGAPVSLEGMAWQGKKLIAAGARRGSSPRVVVARFKANGARDKSFGKKGLRVQRLGNAGAGAVDVATQGKKIVVAAASQSGSAFIVARFKPNGALDKK